MTDSESRQFELLETAARRMSVLSDRLVHLGQLLDIQGVDEEKWGPTIRTMRLISTLGGSNLIAVAGGQSAGKTHLIRNLYPSAADWLEGNLHRGETSPVTIVESAERTEPRGIVVRRRRWDAQGRKRDQVPGDGPTYREIYEPKRRSEWQDI